VLRLDQNLRYTDFDTESECSGFKETEWEKTDTKQFYTDSTYNLGVVQSHCTFKGFHYNHSELQITQWHFQETSLCSSTAVRDFYA